MNDLDVTSLNLLHLGPDVIVCARLTYHAGWLPGNIRAAICRKSHEASPSKLRVNQCDLPDIP